MPQDLMELLSSGLTPTATQTSDQTIPVTPSLRLEQENVSARFSNDRTQYESDYDVASSTILAAALSTHWKLVGWQHSIVLSVPGPDIGQALGPVVGLCGEAVERGMGVYISERALYQ